MASGCGKSRANTFSACFIYVQCVRHTLIQEQACVKHHMARPRRQEGLGVDLVIRRCSFHGRWHPSGRRRRVTRGESMVPVVPLHGSLHCAGRQRPTLASHWTCFWLRQRAESESSGPCTTKSAVGCIVIPFASLPKVLYTGRAVRHLPCSAVDVWDAVPISSENTRPFDPMQVIGECINPSPLAPISQSGEESGSCG